MKTSLILCTYNGADYIVKQLESILTQTRPLDEVLIFDDRSSDNTVLLIKDFISKNNLNDRWTIEVNSENKGWRRNFIDGFHAAKGDILFPCDQDDVWVNNKVEILAGILESKNEIEVIASKICYYYENNNNTDIDKIVSSLITTKYICKQIPLKGNVLETSIPGCALAFRASLIPLVDMIWYPGWAHDSIVSTISKLKHSFYVINKPLIVFRRHNNNNTPLNIRTSEGRIKDAVTYRKRIKLLLENSNCLSLDGVAIQILSDLHLFYLAKIEFFRKRNLKSFIGLMRYHRFYSTFKSFLGDIYIAINNK